MKCFMCQGETRQERTTFMAELGGQIIIIKNVPSEVCAQCGEVSYSDAVARELERLVQALRLSPVEISVANYESRPAA